MILQLAQVIKSKHGGLPNKVSMFRRKCGIYFQSRSPLTAPRNAAVPISVLPVMFNDVGPNAWQMDRKEITSAALNKL
jgi:hypothetical protein